MRAFGFLVEVPEAHTLQLAERPAFEAVVLFDLGHFYVESQRIGQRGAPGDPADCAQAGFVAFADRFDALHRGPP